MTLPDLELKLSQYPSSPLFARLAKEYLSAGRIQEAKQLCVSGLQQFPSYATAHLVLAQCYHAEQNTTKALEYIQEAQSFLPDSAFLKMLYDEWSTHPTEPPLELPQTTVVEEAEPPPEITEQPIAEALQETVVEVAPLQKPTPPPVVEEIQIEEQVISENVEPSPPPQIVAPVEPPATPVFLEAPPSQPIDEGGRIVSKTLAEIYASQGAYAEAILTYQLLKMLRPAQSEEYDLRIKELEPKVQEKTTL